MPDEGSCLLQVVTAKTFMGIILFQYSTLNEYWVQQGKQAQNPGAAASFFDLFPEK